MQSIFIISILLAFGAISAQVSTAQSRTPTASLEVKSVAGTLPGSGSPIRLTALNITRDWQNSITYLKGQVRVEVFVLSKAAPHQVTVLTADQVEFHQETGEILPYGNVRLTIQDVN